MDTALTVRHLKNLVLWWVLWGLLAVPVCYGGTVTASVVPDGQNGAGSGTSVMTAAYNAATDTWDYSWSISHSDNGYSMARIESVTQAQYDAQSGVGNILFTTSGCCGGNGSGSGSTVTGVAYTRILASAFYPTSSTLQSEEWLYMSAAAQTPVCKLALHFSNTKDYQVRYVVVAHGTTNAISDVVVQPGATVDLVLDDSDGIDCNDTYDTLVYVPATSGDGAWVAADLEDGDGVVASEDLEPESVLPEDDPTNIQNDLVPDETPYSVASVSNSIIWQQSTATTDTERLDKATYRAGVDAQLKELRAIKDAIGNLDVGGLDPSDSTNLEKVSDIADQQAQLAAETPSTGTMSSQGDSSGDSASNLLGAVPSGTGYSFTGSAPSLAITLPIAFTGKTVDFNPFSSERFGGVASWFRLAMYWLTLALLASFVWQSIWNWVGNASHAQQARGNPVVAGTGAQATALIAAGLISVAIIAGMTALMAWGLDALNVPGLLTSLSSSPLATIPAGAYWMLDQVLPVSTIITAAVARITFPMWAAKFYVIYAMVVRFVVP